jgi:hypothetical protein
MSVSKSNGRNLYGLAGVHICQQKEKEYLNNAYSQTLVYSEPCFAP